MKCGAQAERSSGIYASFKWASVYKLFQFLISRHENRSWLISHHYRPKQGDRIVDIGCGPGTLASFLPVSCDLYGFDINPNYISDARRNYTGNFIVGNMGDFLDRYGDTLQGTVDLVICCGVLHHVSIEEIDAILTGSKRLLRKEGRFVAIEPTFLERQDLLSKFFSLRDRGQSIFKDFQWAQHLNRHFEKTEIKVVNNLLRIPYVHVLLTGWK